MTKDHKVLVAKADSASSVEWYPAEDIKVGDYVVQPASRMVEGIKIDTLSSSEYDVKDGDILTIGEYLLLKVSEINIVPAGTYNKVYDFTMPETNSYLTDSYVVHNSAAGSLLAYCLDITDADPIRFGLLFERFLNPERESPPDVDVDVNDLDRDKLIAYVKDKYGINQVAQVVTFGKILAKNAVKDTVRILDEPYSLGDQLTKAMPEPVFGKSMPLADMITPGAPRYEEAADFREMVKETNSQHVINIAKGLEGRTRSTGVHAAAVIISNKPVGDAVPIMMRQDDKARITQWDYPTCEELGLIKYDFLGLRNLGIIDNAIKLIEKKRGVKLSYLDIVTGPMDDPKTYELLSQGNTMGVFQLDGGGLQSLLKLMKPTEFLDISAALSLYRPGPMGVNAHTDYALRKNGLQQVTPIHPELEEGLEDILSETFGLIVYQEQIQFIAQKLAGYSLGQADMLRRAMGKKKKSILDAEFKPFSEGMLAKGYSMEAIQALWDVMVPFADYAFNKSHTVAYGLTSYATAYLKANYTAEYMAAVLSSVSDDVDKTAFYLEDCRKNGIKVLPPDVSSSQANYDPVDTKTIRFGLRAIRGIGESVSEAIVKHRHSDPEDQTSPVKPYADWNDFIKRVPRELVNKRVLEGLAYGGALDSIGLSRRAIIHQLPEFLKEYQKKARADAKKATQQPDLFSLDGFDFEETPSWKLYPMDEFPRMEKLKLEREALGLYVSDHPINGLNIENMASTTISNILLGVTKPLEGWPGPRDVPVRIAGVLTSLQIRRTKKGDAMAIARLEDRSGTIEAPIFPKTYQKIGEFLKVDNVYQFVGFPKKRDEDINFMVDNVRPLDFSESGNLSVRLKLTESQWDRGQDALRKLLLAHKVGYGEVGDDVVVSLKNLDGEVRELVLETKVRRSPALLQQVQATFGSLSIGRWLTTKKPVVEEETEQETENSTPVAKPSPQSVSEPPKPDLLSNL